jgi:hypothetical protein
MSAHPFQQKLTGHIRIGRHAIVPGEASHVDFRDHALPIRGLAPDARFVTGAYGASIDPACLMASRVAQSIGMQDYRLYLHYEVRGGVPRNSIGGAEARSTGFLPTGRLVASFRDELHESLRSHMRRMLSPSASAYLDRLSFEDLLVQHPALARVLLDDEPRLDVVVHPVVLQYEGCEEIGILAATVRAERAAQMSVQVYRCEGSVTASCGSTH